MKHEMNIILHKYMCTNLGTELLAVIVPGYFNFFFIHTCIF